MKIILTGLLVIILSASCDHALVYHTNITFDQQKWNKNSIAGFDVEISDTVHPHNILIILRHTSAYPFMNIIFFTTIKGPAGNHITDTANFFIADTHGKWLGKGLGDIHTNQLLLKRNVLFPKSGIYRFEIQQAMRIDDLPGVADAGLRIEKTVYSKN